MEKILKTSILAIIFAIGIYFFVGTEVNAVNKDINSISDFQDYLTNQSITGISTSGNTITLNNSVSIGGDTLNFKNGEYILDLNGKALTTTGYAQIVVDGATLTIKDTVGTGSTTLGIYVKENSTLNIINGKFQESISNEGTLNIQNGIFTTILFNMKNLIIENGNFACVNQSGTATIKGGTFTAFSGSPSYTTEALYVAATAKLTTKLEGGTFTTTDPNCVAITMETTLFGNQDDIYSMISDEYLVNFDGPINYLRKSEDNENYYSTYKNTVTITKNEYLGEFRKISTDGNWTVTSFKPNDAESAEFLLTAIANDCIDTTKYEVSAGCADWQNADVTKIIVHLTNKATGEHQSHILNVTYNIPNAMTIQKIAEVLTRMKYYESHEDMSVKSAYMLDDLYLINYLYANSKGFDADGGSGKALNFAKDLINAINGSNISFKFDPRAGENTQTGLYEFAMGQAIVYYNGIACTSKNAAVTVNHVIYIPDTTEQTTEAYEAAVLKRIQDYLGISTGISVEFGGTLESLNYQEERYGDLPGGGWGSIGMVDVTYNENELIDDNASDGNYYNITINGETYRFAVLTKEESKLEVPKYVGSDILSNISVSSDDTTIPLDTALTVNEVSNKEIENAIGTSVYAAYDISLYSGFKKASVTSLDNGKFIVSVPVPENLKDKEIIVYYITSKGEKEIHNATVENGIASFETDHFSTYILAESSKDNTPKTGIKNNTIIAISTLGMIATVAVVVIKKARCF